MNGRSFGGPALVVGLVIAALAATTVAQQGTAAPPRVAAQFPATLGPELDRAIEAGRTAAKIPGLTVAIAFRNTIVYTKAFGHADLEHRAPATPRTAFRTASTAKPLTATAVMLLVEQGRLDLDAPIQQYCPAFPEKPWPVTARLLLGHQAGIRHYQKPGESTGKAHYFTLQDALGLFKNDPLLHEPGTKYFYSTYGFSVLGCAIEGASGLSFEAFMRARVFTPAGMARTRFDRVYEIVPERSRGYQILTAEALQQLPREIQAFAKAGEIYNAEMHDTSMKVPGGGFVSTAEDLMRFVTALRTSACGTGT